MSKQYIRVAAEFTKEGAVNPCLLYTSKKDAVKLANYGLDHWLTLPRYVPEEDTRLMLQTCYRQYQQYSKVQNLSLIHIFFPGSSCRGFFRRWRCFCPHWRLWAAFAALPCITRWIS